MNNEKKTVDFIEISITAEQMKALEDNIMAGLDFATAVNLSGVPESTFYLYKGQAKNATKKVAKGMEINDREKELIEFLERIKKADAIATKRNVLVIQTAAIEQWQAAAWFLERRHKKQYGRNDNINLRGTVRTLDGPTPTKELEKKLKELKKNARQVAKYRKNRQA